MRYSFGIQDPFNQYVAQRRNAAFQVFSELVFKPIADMYLNRTVTKNNSTIKYKVIQIDFQEPLEDTIFHLQNLTTGAFIQERYGNNRIHIFKRKKTR